MVRLLAVGIGAYDRLLGVPYIVARFDVNPYGLAICMSAIFRTTKRAERHRQLQKLRRTYKSRQAIDTGPTL